MRTFADGWRYFWAALQSSSLAAWLGFCVAISVYNGIGLVVMSLFKAWWR